MNEGVKNKWHNALEISSRGAGYMPVYRLNDGSDYVILGLRFGTPPTFQWTVGGTVEPGDTNGVAARREYKEENYCAPYIDDRYIEDTFRFYHEPRNDYYTFYIINKYFSTYEDLEDMVYNYLNPRAEIANELLHMISSDYSPTKQRTPNNRTIEGREEMRDILKDFFKYFVFNRDLCGDYDCGIKKETIYYLREYTGDENAPQYVLEDVKKFTEYSEFIIMPLKEVLELYSDDSKIQENGLFAPEANAVMALFPDWEST